MPKTMPCEHRFLNFHYTPTWPIKYLFVGTFNPSWDKPGHVGPDWFYRRPRNYFWRIMPPLFGGPDLKQHGIAPEALVQWCQRNAIGLTDLVHTINDADQNDPNHVALIQGFQDNALEQFLLAPNEAIAQLIEENNESLEGVFLTRYEHTFMPNGQLRALWESVEAVCDQNDIPSSPLVTPSGGYRGMTVPEKQEAWRGMIFPAP